MPARKNHKKKAGSGLSGPEENVSVSMVAFEQEYEAGEGPSPFPGHPGKGRKHASAADRIAQEEADADLILTYLAFYRHLEQALVRAGFVRVISSHNQPRPDWYRWAMHIEKQFDPASDDVLHQSVDHLLLLRDDMEALPGRWQNRLQWESASPYSDILWLTEMLQETSLRLTQRYNFADTPGCDAGQVMAALFVVQAWLELISGCYSS